MHLSSVLLLAPTLAHIRVFFFIMHGMRWIKFMWVFNTRIDCCKMDLSHKNTYIQRQVFYEQSLISFVRKTQSVYKENKIYLFAGLLFDGYNDIIGFVKIDNVPPLNDDNMTRAVEAEMGH